MSFNDNSSDTLADYDKNIEPYLNSILQKKATDVVALNVSKITSIADVFIIASGSSNRQVSAIAEFVHAELKKLDLYPLHIEGLKEGHWVLLDYGNVIIHIFYEPIRKYYDLEGLWIEAKKIYPNKMQVNNLKMQGTDV